MCTLVCPHANCAKLRVLVVCESVRRARPFCRELVRLARQFVLPMCFTVLWVRQRLRDSVRLARPLARESGRFARPHASGLARRTE